jgi:hypothetical protein
MSACCSRRSAGCSFAYPTRCRNLPARVVRLKCSVCGRSWWRPEVTVSAGYRSWQRRFVHGVKDRYAYRCRRRPVRAPTGASSQASECSRQQRTGTMVPIQQDALGESGCISRGLPSAIDDAAHVAVLAALLRPSAESHCHEYVRILNMRRLSSHRAAGSIGRMGDSLLRYRRTEAADSGVGECG